MTRTCAHCGTTIGLVWLTVCEHILCISCEFAGMRRAISHTCLCADVETSGPLAPVVAARAHEKRKEAA